jgi:hypothetical protein
MMYTWLEDCAIWFGTGILFVVICYHEELPDNELCFIYRMV